MKLLKHKLAVFFLWLAHKVDGKFVSSLTYNATRKEPLTVEDVGERYQQIIQNDEPSGIVMRPTVQELAKMNEDQATREAKEAIAETIRNAEEPKI